jgi:hypothetical protein
VAKERTNEVHTRSTGARFHRIDPVIVDAARASFAGGKLCTVDHFVQVCRRSWLTVS